jgi:hypothetical protein
MAAVTATSFLNAINKVVLNPLIYLVFTLAFVYFLFGLAQFIKGADSPKGRDEGKQKILWGLVGMFVMFGAYGIIHLILATFGLNPVNTHQGYINF